MASLPWVKIDVDLPSHPKLLHLQELLGTTDALGIILRMFCWAAKFCPTGKVPKHVARPLAAEAVRGAVMRDGYGNPDACLQALQDSGWLEEQKDCFELHDWDDFQGAHIEAAEKNREKQRRYRDRNRGSNRNAPVTRNGYVPTLDEMRGDEKRLDPKRSADPAARPPEPLQALQPSLNANAGDDAAPWPSDLVEQMRGPLKRQIPACDNGYSDFLRESARQYPAVQRRVNAGLVLLERAADGSTFGFGYVWKLLAEGAEPRRARVVNGERQWTDEEKESFRRRNQPPSIPERPETSDEINARKLAEAEERIRARKGGGT
jgi:hypothetical protein